MSALKHLHSVLPCASSWMNNAINPVLLIMCLISGHFYGQLKVCCHQLTGSNTRHKNGTENLDNLKRILKKSQKNAFQSGIKLTHRDSQRLFRRHIKHICGEVNCWGQNAHFIWHRPDLSHFTSVQARIYAVSRAVTRFRRNKLPKSEKVSSLLEWKKEEEENKTTAFSKTWRIKNIGKAMS